MVQNRTPTSTSHVAKMILELEETEGNEELFKKSFWCQALPESTFCWSSLNIGCSDIIALISQFYRSFTLIFSSTTIRQVWPDTGYFCCCSEKDTVLQRSKCFHSRSHGQLAAKVEQKRDISTSSSMPFLSDYTSFSIFWKVPSTFFSSLTAFFFLKKNKTPPS